MGRACEVVAVLAHTVDVHVGAWKAFRIDQGLRRAGRRGEKGIG